MSRMITELRRLGGVIALDRPRYLRALAAPDGYLGVCNRGERLESGPDGRGYRCDWRWTSDLHAPKYLPSLGLRLMRAALQAHPVSRLPAPINTGCTPRVSFLIGHRGGQRLPHLLATIESIAAQIEVPIECVVVEQDEQALAAASLPNWVRYVHAPPPSVGMPFSRALAFNTAAREARGDLLVLHDGDLLVPVDYARDLLKLAEGGWQAVNLKRFIFFLRQAHTQRYLHAGACLVGEPPESVMQNAQGGGSIAITRMAYERIGGMDESFVGWGGEDNEFWERAQTLKTWSYAWLPLVHLWHLAQAGKYDPANPTLEHYRALSLVPPEVRIKRLSQQLERPAALSGSIA